MPPGSVDPRSPYASDHARSRAAERLGFEPTPDQWREAALSILDTIAGQRIAALLIRKSVPYGGVSLLMKGEIWAVKIGARQARVIWSPVNAVIVTVLP